MLQEMWVGNGTQLRKNWENRRGGAVLLLEGVCAATGDRTEQAVEPLWDWRGGRLLTRRAAPGSSAVLGRAMETGDPVVHGGYGGQAPGPGWPGRGAAGP
jgi:hypothetical protein